MISNILSRNATIGSSILKRSLVNILVTKELYIIFVTFTILYLKTLMLISGVSFRSRFMIMLLSWRRNGNVKWQDATTLEIESLVDYTRFKDLGPKEKARPPIEYQRIGVHLIFDAQHDGCHEFRCVADGRLTDVPVGSIYSGVVS